MNKFELSLSHCKLDVWYNLLLSLANIKLDLPISLNPRPPFSKLLTPVIWSNVKLRLLKLQPFKVKLDLILILSRFNVVVDKS